MRAYADTSFLAKLAGREPGSEKAVAEFRRLGSPQLFYLPLHALEVPNAFRQRAFHLRRSATPQQRRAIDRERDAALARIGLWLERGSLLEITADCDVAFAHARELSTRHTERLGCRGFDLLHVAFALDLKCEAFLTADRVQGELARAEGLAVTVCDAG